MAVYIRANINSAKNKIFINIDKIVKIPVEIHIKTSMFKMLGKSILHYKIRNKLGRNGPFRYNQKDKSKVLYDWRYYSSL